MCRGVTATSECGGQASNTETNQRILATGKNSEKSQAVDFKGFLYFGTATAISMAEQE